MSLQAALAMDAGAYNSPGPMAGHVTANATPGGLIPLDAVRASYGGTTPSRSPHGGIAYIDQAIGGESTPRGDTRATGFGFRSRKQKTQAFNGDYIGGTIIRANRNQGQVGLNKANTAQRIRATNRVQVPDTTETQAAFTSPALIAALGVIRGGGRR